MTRWISRIRLLVPALALAAVAVALNQWVIDHPRRWDLTSSGVYSFGPQTARVLDGLQQPVKVTFFYDLRSKEMNDARALLDQYAARSDRLTVRSVDPAIAPAEARRMQVQFAGTAVLESNGRRVVVNGGSEADLTNGLIRVTAAADRTVCFTDGHAEADPLSLSSHDHFEGDMGAGHSHGSGGRALVVQERHGMGMAREALLTLGYAARVLSPASGGTPLEGCAVVVIGGPQQAFLPAEVAQLRSHAAGGGRFLVLADPFVDSGLAPLFADFGVHLQRRLVLDDASHYWTDPATPAISRYPRHQVTRNLAMTFFPGAAPLVPVRRTSTGGEVRLTPLVQTSDRARSEPVGSEAGAVEPGLQTIAVLASRELGGGRRSDMILVGDSDFATNSFFHILGNGNLFLNAVSLLADRQQLIDIAPRQYELPRVQLTNGQMRVTFLLSAVLLPLAALALAGWVWWRRRG